MNRKRNDVFREKKKKERNKTHRPFFGSCFRIVVLQSSIVQKLEFLFLPDQVSFSFQISYFVVSQQVVCPTLFYEFPKVSSARSVFALPNRGMLNLLSVFTSAGSSISKSGWASYRGFCFRLVGFGFSFLRSSFSFCVFISIAFWMRMITRSSSEQVPVLKSFSFSVLRRSTSLRNRAASPPPSL